MNKVGLTLLILLTGALNILAQERDSLYQTASSVHFEDFNRGKTVSLFQLIQSRVPGFTYYRNSGDPNAKQNVGIRGINSYSNIVPIYLDGIPIISEQLINPGDIENIRVVNDLATNGILGNRARSGAIYVTTKSANNIEHEKINIDYSFQYAISEKAEVVNVLDSEGYLAIGGNDLGGNINWQEAITRTGYSNNQNLAISGSKDKTKYYFSANLHQIDGILLNSGYNQRNFRLGVDQSLLNEKLNVSVDLYSNVRDSDLSFKEAFGYAITQMPTSAISGSDVNIGGAAFFAPYNGYFHPVGLFNSYNPYAMVTLNSNISEANDLLFVGDVSYQLNENLILDAVYSNQSLDVDNFEFYSIYDAYRGRAGTSSPGLARKRTAQVDQSTFDISGSYSGIASHFNYNVSVGYNYQIQDFYNLQEEARGFDNDQEVRNFFDTNYDSNAGLNLQSERDPSETISNFYLKGSLDKVGSYSIDIAIHAQTGTLLENDKKTDVFPSVKGRMPLDFLFDDEKDQDLTVSLGYGTSGSLPTEFGVSNNFYVGGNTVNFASNPDLEIEKTSEINFAIDFSINRLTSSLVLYQRNVSDLIYERNVDVSFYGVPTRFENFGSLKTRGIEVYLKYDFIKTNKTAFSSSLILSSYKTTIDDIGINQFMTGSPGSPGHNSTNVIRITEGEELGMFWGPVYSGQVDANGVPIMSDLNDDGILQSSQTFALAENSDFQELGNANPDLELGWFNHLNVGNLNLNFLIQGAFGHSLVNTNRLFYEPRDDRQNSYNNVNSEFAEDQLERSLFSSHYVEKADFVRLQFVELGYSFNTNTIRFVRSLRASFIIENVLTITNYTGANPEPVFFDYGAINNDGYENNFPTIFTAGIDRGNRYFPERSILFGINIGF